MIGINLNASSELISSGFKPYGIFFDEKKIDKNFKTILKNLALNELKKSLEKYSIMDLLNKEKEQELIKLYKRFFLIPYISDKFKKDIIFSSLEVISLEFVENNIEVIQKELSHYIFNENHEFKFKFFNKNKVTFLNVIFIKNLLEKEEKLIYLLDKYSYFHSLNLDLYISSLKIRNTKVFRDLIFYSKTFQNEISDLISIEERENFYFEFLKSINRSSINTYFRKEEYIQNFYEKSINNVLKIVKKMEREVFLESINNIDSMLLNIEIKLKESKYRGR